MIDGPITLGADHLSNSATFEVQRTNNFELVIEGFGEDFTLSVEGTNLPTVSNEPIELSYGNSKVKVAGQATYDDVTVTVKDVIGADMELKLWEWRKQVYDPETDKVGWAKDYKRGAYLYQYAPDGTYLRPWKLKGCWPSTFESAEYAYEGGDKKVVTLTLSVDKAYPYRDRG